MTNLALLCIDVFSRNQMLSSADQVVNVMYGQERQVLASIPPIGRLNEIQAGIRLELSCVCLLHEGELDDLSRGRSSFGLDVYL